MDEPKKRKGPPATKTITGHIGKKPRTVTPVVEGIEDTAKFDSGHNDMISSQLGQLLPLLSQLHSTASNAVYLHPSLATSKDFKLSKPAHTVIPEKDTSGPRKIRVKRRPTWNLETELTLFGAYYQANGIDYSPSDISTLARSIPDVSLCPLTIVLVAYGGFLCLLSPLMLPMDLVFPVFPWEMVVLVFQAISMEKSVLPAKVEIVFAHTTGASKSVPSCLMLLMLPLIQGPKVLLTISLSYALLNFPGFKDVLQAFGEARDAYDSLLNIVNDSQKALAKAHDRLASEILCLRDVAANPGLFFQNLIEVYPKLVITYDLLCYYATLFDWNSSLNFSSVIQRHTTVAAWLKSNNVPLSIEEPMTAGPMKQVS